MSQFPFIFLLVQVQVMEIGDLGYNRQRFTWEMGLATHLHDLFG
jgi:hypothetical protein